MATIESVSPELAFHIRQNTQWGKLPPSVKEVHYYLKTYVIDLFTHLFLCLLMQSMNNSRGVYEQNIVQYSIANQLVWKTNLGGCD